MLVLRALSKRQRGTGSGTGCRVSELIQVTLGVRIIFLLHLELFRMLEVETQTHVKSFRSEI